MKRIILLELFLFCIVAFTISFAAADTYTVSRFELSEREVGQESRLPASLKIIEDEAFEGTALIEVELPDTVIKVGEYAFADISTLHTVKVLGKTTHIADSAFDDSNRVTITAPKNSYARSLANEKGIPFSPIVLFCASSQSSTISAITIDRSREIIETDSATELRPETKWRSFFEINITRTEEIIANHVQGRSPPMA